MQAALSSGSALALASVAFLAVYREGVETILFYKALLASGGAGDAGAVIAGVALGAVVLVLLYVLLMRLGVRIPMKAFFAVTGALLYYMAFVFAGKGVAELQESRVVGHDGHSVARMAPRPVPRRVSDGAIAGAAGAAGAGVGRGARWRQPRSRLLRQRRGLIADR